MKRNLVTVTPTPKRWLSTRELKVYLDCSEDFIESIKQSHIVVVCKIGGEYLYDINSVDKFILSQKL